MAQPRRHHTWILALLLLVFGALFVMRGPVRGLHQGADLAHLYAAATLFLEGGNPYDGEQCVEAMARADYENPEHVGNGSFYPPPTIAALSPLGLLGWDAARVLWLVINLASSALLVWVLSQWLRLEAASTRWMLAMLIVVAWGPVATAFSLGQLSIAATACVFAGLVMIDRGKGYLAGLLIGLGCLIKPQLGLGFLVLIALRRDWLALSIGSALIAVVTGLSIGRLMMTAPDWASQMAGNIASDQASGEVLDASLAGPLRFQMIDIRPLLHLALPGSWVNLSAVLVVIALTGAALAKLLRAGLQRHALLAASGVGLLVLLPVYHRYYDAVLLLPLLALVCNQLALDRRDILMGLIALAMLVMVLPVPSLLSVLHQKEIVPDALHGSWAWQHVVMQIQSWSLLLSAIALVVWAWRHCEAQHEA